MRRSRIVVFVGTGLWVGLSVLTWATLTVWLVSSGLAPLPAVNGLDDAVSDQNGTEPLTIRDRFGRGDALATVLTRNGFRAAEVHGLARALSAVMDVRHLRPGDEIEIRYGEGRAIDAVWIHRGSLNKIKLTPSALGWQSEATRVDLERRTVALAGVLEDNLFLSMDALGESAPLTIAFANVFAWDFDFHTQSRNGDRFSLIVEKLYRDGAFVGYGALRAARYVSFLGGERVFTAFLFEDPDGNRDYYDPDGKSMRKAFLRAPLDFQRVSSGFSYNRLHPVHKRRMPHLGVDYAAPKGTPVYSIGAGVVTGRGFRGGGGNTVTIRHAMGYTSKYLHLSRFAKGLRVGQRVEQKQVIGYVGDTGTVTAAHLDFRLIKHGRPVNPLTQIFPPGPPVAEEFRGEFETAAALLASQLALPRNRMVVTLD